MKYPAIAIIGPTASGKSELAVQLAQKYGGEVISADSRQVYRGLNLGSGKITKKEMRGVPHHLLDVANTKRVFTVAQYQKLAQKSLGEIIERGHLPIVCGGTHFYVQALIENLALPPVKPNLKLREELEKLSAKELFVKLKKLDPVRASNIDPHNHVRLIRAIEILSTPSVDSPQYQGDTLTLGCRWLVLAPEITDEKIKENIKIRLKKRLKMGMVKEVEKLRKAGVSFKRLDSFGLEYRFIALYLQNKISKKEMIKNIETASWQLARRQKTWLRKLKPVWVKNQKEAEKVVIEFVRRDLGNRKVSP